MSETKVTVRLTPNSKNPKFAGFATVDILGMQRVEGIGLWKNEDGVGVEMPYTLSTKLNPKTKKPYKNYTFRYLNEAHQAQFNELIVKAYNQKIGATTKAKAEEAQTPLM